jgi:uncharacterized protein YjbJ (UPF0337 family)
MSLRREAMNWDTVKGDWKQFQGKVKEQWGKLTDDDLHRIEGRRDQLAGAIQKRYGIEKDEAEKQVMAFEHKCGECDDEESRSSAGSRVVAGHDMHNPSKEKTEGGMRHQQTPAPQSNDPKAQKPQGVAGDRTKDREMAERNMEHKQTSGGQKQQSQTSRAKKE